MFITENFNQKRENDKIRMEIIRKVTEIYDKRSLENILCFVEAVHADEILQHPYTVTEVASAMDIDELTDAISYLMKKDKKMDYRTMIVDLLDKVHTQAVLKRVYKLLERLYLQEG